MAFRSRKQFSCVNILAIADYRTAFLWIGDTYAGIVVCAALLFILALPQLLYYYIRAAMCAGSMSDKVAFRQSRLAAEMKNGTWIKPAVAGEQPKVPLETVKGIRIGPYILADPAFDHIGSCIMKRFPDPQDEMQQLWNLVQSSGRQVIERAWALLVLRFRCLKYQLSLAGRDWLLRISNIIVACMVLHNVCLDRADDAVDIFAEPPPANDSAEVDPFDQFDFNADVEDRKQNDVTYNASLLALAANAYSLFEKDGSSYRKKRR